ncbi:hypothetical protein OG875_18680 [Streptomyces sp. NBC_01498]|uniref:hypothetical protein n=1 Tax=Streptomyces sp. NBC_01498 TaxID=2975870 RepID=UPI002E7BF3E9|nr:hypothetical protein [Streptomyces sp. NBC_01498]WTL26432.1 hypothetical protein OG875_18680 [Streptomyces sp. NBC_01498]
MPGVEVRYWYEHVTHHPLTAGGPDVEKAEHHTADTPAEAIRLIRKAVHALAAALPPKERKRALSWAEGGGCVRAIAALHRGETCGFSLGNRGAWLEWTVRPYHEFRTPEGRRLPLVPADVPAGTPH